MKAKVTVRLFDASTQEAEGTLFSLADRIAFERRFQVPAAKTSDLERWIYVEDDREVKERPELKGRLKPGTGDEFREEWFTFFAFRLLRRSGATDDEFDAWLEKVDEVDLAFEEAEANPTTGAPQSGS
jgi:hypothetical protein